MPPRPSALLSHLRYPTTLLLTLPYRPLSTAPPSSQRGKAECTRFLIRQPSPSASRECPTPIVFLRTPGLVSDPTSPASGRDSEEWTDWSGMFSEKGYTAVEVDIAPPDLDHLDGYAPQGERAGASGQGGGGSPSPLGAMTTLLSQQIRLMAIPFPPIIVAQGSGCLVAQTYVEDHPASGLVMLDPPADEDPAGASPVSATASSLSSSVSSALSSILPSTTSSATSPSFASSPSTSTSAASAGGRRWHWPKFGYEPRFPILLLADRGGVERVKMSRVGKEAEKGVGRGGKGVSVLQVRDGWRGEGTRVEVEKWMDRCGF